MGAPAAPAAKLAGTSCRPTRASKNLVACRAAVLIDNIQVCMPGPHAHPDKLMCFMKATSGVNVCVRWMLAIVALQLVCVGQGGWLLVQSPFDI